MRKDFGMVKSLQHERASTRVIVKEKMNDPVSDNVRKNGGEFAVMF